MSLPKFSEWDLIDYVFALSVAIIVLVIAIPLSLVIAIPIIKSTTGISNEYSSGERSGIVYKMSNSGFIWKTWEGEMNLGGVKSGDNSNVANIWHFSVTDPILVKRLQDATHTNQHLILNYTEPFLMQYRIGASGYLVTSIFNDDNQEKK